MTKNRRMLCWLLLLVLLLCQAFSLSVGEAYARYDSTVVANAVVEPKVQGITSNCMVKAGDPSLTVLLGRLDEPKSVSFWLKSNGAPAPAGALLWSVVEPEKYLDYVQITMKIDDVAVDPGVKIDLLQDAAMSFDMTVAASAIGKTAEHEELKINVVVTWGDEMWGTFQVILPEVLPEEEQPQTNNDNETNVTPETTPTEEVGDSAAGETVISEEEKASLEALANLLAAQNAAEGGETEPTTPETEPPATTEPPAPVETTGPTEETQPPVSPDDPIQLKTLSRFDPAYALPVKMSVSEDITSIRMGREVEEAGVTSFEPLPDNTLLSLDHGKSYFMLYNGYIAEFTREDLEDGKSISVLLDFSRTELEEDDTLVLAMEACTESGLKTTRSAQTTADARESCLSLVHPLEGEAKAVAFSAGDTRESAAAAEEFGWRSRMLTKDSALEFVIPMEWLDAEVEYSVEMLTMTEEQTLEYIPVVLSAAGLHGKYQDFDQTHNLVLQVGEDPPQAGTYRLNMNWSYEGICFAKSQTTFFINYSAYTAQMLGG